MQSQNKYSSRFGYAYVALAAALWASSGSAAKFLFMNGLNASHLVQLRASIAALLLFLWMFARKRPLLKIERKDLAYFMRLGAALAATQFTYLYAISKINVAAAILLQYQAPVLIAGYALFFTSKRMSPFTLAAIPVAIAGCFLMVGAYNPDILQLNRQGIIFGLASALAFAVYSVESEYGMRSYFPWTVVFYALLFAAVIWNVIEPPFSAFTLAHSQTSWWWIFFIAVFGTIIPFGFYNEGIKLILSTRASITATLEPIMAGAISFLFLGEVMKPLQIIGAGLVISSIVILQLKKDPE
ncbi:MAG: EamA family transporter [Nitrospiraceae bacterium]|nr:MAG: EamA family transporter [Nitrospiraceae bacterium]